MIALPRKIQRFLVISAVIFVSILLFYQITKLLVELATDSYVASDFSPYRNGHYDKMISTPNNNNYNDNNNNNNSDNTDIINDKYILSDRDFYNLNQKTYNIPILYVSRHEGTISNFKYIGDTLKWNVTIYSPEVFILLI